jgi:glutamate-5-semialdehyde dehydrogenase
MIQGTLNVARAMMDIAARARAASRSAAGWPHERKDDALLAMAASLRSEKGAILASNGDDLEAGRAAGLSDAMLDRLRLDHNRLEAVARQVEDIASLPDPVGEIISVHEHRSGLRIERVRVPLGVVLMIYESRPNVTVDAAALAFKAGNAAILRGGSEAMRTNRALHGAISRHAPTGAIQLVETTDRAAVTELLKLDGLIDLVIPRGGEGLIRAVADHSRIPVLKHYKGVCHVYVDAAADLDMAERIIVNAKCQRPGVCNAAETLLVHERIADAFLPRAARALIERGVELRCDERARRLVSLSEAATEDDWSAEYLALILAVGIVRDLDEATAHIGRYGSRHSEAIVTEDVAAAERFLRDVDAAAVYVNASTRFTDGGEFGLGAEIGVSTDKLHARGPCGLESLTTYKYLGRGSGQVRD